MEVNMKFIAFLICCFTFAVSAAQLEEGPYTTNSANLTIPDILRGSKAGHCDCECLRPVCNHPKNANDCSACYNAIKGSLVDSKSSWEGGKCWIRLGFYAPLDCSRLVYLNWSGCTGFAGIEHYTYGNACWAHYRNP